MIVIIRLSYLRMSSCDCWHILHFLAQFTVRDSSKCRGNGTGEDVPVARRRARSNLWNAPKTSKDVYQTSRFFAIRREQRACKFSTVVCILKVLDSRHNYAGERRGRDLEAATADNARHLRHLERNEEKNEKRREENRTRERGTSRRKAK